MRGRLEETLTAFLDHWSGVKPGDARGREAVSTMLAIDFHNREVLHIFGPQFVNHIHRVLQPLYTSPRVSVFHRCNRYDTGNPDESDGTRPAESRFPA